MFILNMDLGRCTWFDEYYNDARQITFKKAS